ncbi:RNA polymerase sigma factor [Nocardioides sediminis]|uniref:RNA polymerase sigma factor n=1 Tax=Nocardioides sediminis TaxID=433648 RepID=UPI001901A0F0|nr:sigma-70 family RNA polymerase sigma factor [Nocardioides sediminis]
MGGRDLIDELYDASYGRLVVQMLALCGNQADAEDAVQEAFVRALLHRERLAHADRPEAWLRTVALNQLRNHWRHTKVARRLLVQVPGPRAGLDLGPDHVALVAALQQLDATSREVVVLHHLAGLSVSEVGHQLGMPEGTVKSRLSRSRARLAGLLDDQHDDREVEPRA